MAVGVCLPWWHALFAPYVASPKVVRSGCATVDGYVQCSPGAMAADAARQIGRPVTPDAYSIARLLASEGTGSRGTVEEKVLVALLARNKARQRGITPTKLLACTNERGVCLYGPINVVGADDAAPYGRWAATSKDPTVGDLLIAQFVMEGQADDFAPGVVNQRSGLGGFYAKRSNLEARAREGEFWVGPLPNVNHFHVFAFRKMPFTDKDPRGQVLIDRALAAAQASEPDWRGLRACARGTSRYVTLATVALTAAVLGGIIYLAKPPALPRRGRRIS